MRCRTRHATGSNDRDYRGVVSRLHQNGVYDVFIKWPQKNQVPSYCTNERLESEIVEMLKAMKTFNDGRANGTPAVRAWVWERTWLWRDRGGFRADQYDAYVNDMTGVVQRAKREGVAGPLEGMGSSRRT